MMILLAQIQGLEKNRHGARSLRANVTVTRNMSEDWREELRWFLLWLENGDNVVFHGGEMMEVNVIYGQYGWKGFCASK